MKIGFDNAKYLKIQSEHIKERIGQFGDKLYLEFGGKLFDDYHASRVLPGFAPDSKLQMLMQLSDMAEIVIVISARDIEKNKVRGDLGITYDDDVLREERALCGKRCNHTVLRREQCRVIPRAVRKEGNQSVYSIPDRRIPGKYSADRQ